MKPAPPIETFRPTKAEKRHMRISHSSINHVRKVMHALICSACLLVTLSSAAEARAIRFVTIAGSPFGFLDKAGAPTGINVEIANSIGAEIGLPYENAIVPYARALAMIETGDADLMIAFPNRRLDAAATRVGPIADLENVVLGRAGTILTGLHDLRGKTVASVRGAEYDAALSADPEIAKYSVNNYEHGLSMLLAGRVDAIVGMKTGIYYQIAAMGSAREELGTPLVLNTKNALLYYSRRNYDEEVLAKVRQALAALISRKAIQRIELKYFGKHDAPPR